MVWPKELVQYFQMRQVPISKREQIICLLLGVEVTLENEHKVKLVTGNHLTGVLKCPKITRNFVLDDNHPRLKKVTTIIDQIKDRVPNYMMQQVQLMCNGKGPASCRKCRFEIPDVSKQKHTCPIRLMQNFVDTEDTDALISDFETKRADCPKCKQYVREKRKTPIVLCTKCRPKENIMEAPMQCRSCQIQLTHFDDVTFFVDNKKTDMVSLDTTTNWQVECLQCCLKSSKQKQLQCKVCSRVYNEKSSNTTNTCQSCLKKKNLHTWKQVLQMLDNLSKVCVMCGDSAKLHCDHIDPLTKSAGIYDMAIQGHSIEDIKKEILKCRLICVACHSFVTKLQRKSGLAAFKKLRLDPEVHNHTLQKLYNKLRSVENDFATHAQEVRAN